MDETKPSTSATPAPSIIAALEAVEGLDLLTMPESTAAYAHDRAVWAAYDVPVAVVRPRTTEQVRAVVAACIEHSTPLVTRGAGTGLSGGANATIDAVVLSLERMDKILEIDVEHKLARVKPGIINDDFRAALVEHGLWYPPDPASSPWSTIGGNVATNAGGMCCVKYGVTGDYVRELEVVTGTGEVVRLGRRTAKGVAGFDLRGLMVGSEGTLGVVTEVVVRLRPLPPPATTVIGNFDSLEDAGRAVALIGASGISPSLLELVDRGCLEAVDAWKHMGLASEADAVLIGRSDAPGASGEQEVAELLRCFEAAGATYTAASTDEQESEALYAARRFAFPAMERLGVVLTEDICVPLSRVPDVLAQLRSIGERHDVKLATIAHAGDGNLHPLLVTPPGDEAAGVRAQAAFDEIIQVALDAGGTVTGEHGIGLLKRDGLARELSPAVAAMHHAVKAALDPHGILNPGKALPIVRPT